jgi:hypothetical protein
MLMLPGANTMEFPVRLIAGRGYEPDGLTGQPGYKTQGN